MNNNNFSETKTYKLSEYIYRAFLTTVCFILFTLMGIVIFSLGPAIKAAQKMTMDFNNGYEEPFFKTYFSYFKKDYLKSMFTSLFYIILLTIIILINYFGISKLENKNILGILIVVSSIIFIFIIHGFSSCYYFINKFDTKYIDAIRFSFTISWSKLSLVILNLLLILVTIILILPLPFMFIGIYFFISLKLFDNTFKNVDKNKINSYYNNKGDNNEEEKSTHN